MLEQKDYRHSKGNHLNMESRIFEILCVVRLPCHMLNSLETVTISQNPWIFFSDNKDAVFAKGAYFLGKVVWGKGWEELLCLLDYCKQTDSYCPATAIHCFGDGEARASVRLCGNVTLASPNQEMTIGACGKANCNMKE